MKYIDAEKLYKQVDEQMAHFVELEKEAKSDDSIYYQGKIKMCSELLGIIDSLQQTEDVVTTANVLLEALSKTPYNNKPITDAQIIVRQLLLFFENPKEYNPDAILEQPDVDLEKALNGLDNAYFDLDGIAVKGATYYLTVNDLKDIARDFYELGLKARKGDCK